MTDRERSGLGYFPTRLSNRETASELYVSLNTLKTHLQSTTANLASIAEPQQSTERRTSACSDELPHESTCPSPLDHPFGMRTRRATTAIVRSP